MKRFALLLLLIATPAFAGPGTDAVRKANDTINAELKAKAAAATVTTSVNNFIDIDQLGKDAMGANWSTLKPDEQQKFLALLHQVIEANYVKGMNANLSYTVNYTGEAKDANGNLVVKTEIVTQKKGRPISIEVNYVLDAKLHAFDVITDDSSLVQAYSDQFKKLMANGGYANLMQKMTDALAKIQATPAASTGTGTGSAATPAPAKS